MSIDATRDAILVVADKLFSRFGFHKTSMDEIAKTARKAKGSLYYHFASKEDLFKEVVSLEFENLKLQLTLILNNTSINPPEKLQQYLIKRMEVLAGAHNYHETLKADFFEHFHFLDTLRNDLTNWEIQSIRQIFTEGMEQGYFDKELNLDVMLNVAALVFRGLEMPFYIEGKYNEYAPHFGHLLKIIMKGIS